MNIRMNFAKPGYYTIKTKLVFIMITVFRLIYPLKCAPAKQQMHTPVDISTTRLIDLFVTSCYCYIYLSHHQPSKGKTAMKNPDRRECSVPDIISLPFIAWCCHHKHIHVQWLPLLLRCCQHFQETNLSGQTYSVLTVSSYHRGHEL